MKSSMFYKRMPILFSVLMMLVFHYNGFTQKAEKYFNKGNRHFKHQKYDKAIKDYSKAILINPKFINAFIRRGLAYEFKERRFVQIKSNIENAIIDFTSAIKIDSNNLDIYNYRGISYYFLKNYQMAVNDFTKYLETDSSNIKVLFNRGYTNFLYKKYESAIKDFTTILDLKPEKNSIYHFFRGKSYELLGKYDLAKKDLSGLEPYTTYFDLSPWTNYTNVPVTIGTIRSYSNQIMIR